MAIASLRSARTDPSLARPDLVLDADAAASIRRLFRAAWIASLGLIVGFGGWAGLTSISGAVIALGTVAVDGKHKAVQHLDGGTIARIDVKDGALVEAGSVLVRLDARDLENEKASLDREIAARSTQVGLIEGGRAQNIVPRHAAAPLQRRSRRPSATRR